MSWLSRWNLCWSLPLAILLGFLGGMVAVKYPMLGVLTTLGMSGVLVLILAFFGSGAFSLQHAFVLLLLASVLLPPLRLPSGIPSLRPELIIVLTAWGGLILGHFATGRPVSLRRNKIYKWFVLFGLVVSFSIFYASVLKNNALSGRDFWELAKLIEYFLIFTLVANLKIRLKDIRRYYKIALLLFVCSASFGLAQYLDLGEINNVVSPYYAPTQMEGLLRQGRITGTTANPNLFGAVMVLPASLSLSGALFFRQKNLRLLSYICFLLFSFAIVLTISRSALIALGVATATILCLKYPRIVGVQKYIQRLLILAPILLVTFFIILQLAPSNFFFRVAELGDIGSSTSWQGRLSRWQESFSLWMSSPIFGVGPGKLATTISVDNEWLLLLRRYGIVGVVVFICWFGSLYLGLTRVRTSSVTEEVTTLTVALQATLVAYAVFMIPAVIYHSLQLMPILLIFVGLAYSQWPPESTIEETPK